MAITRLLLAKDAVELGDDCPFVRHINCTIIQIQTVWKRVTQI